MTYPLASLSLHAEMVQMMTRAELDDMQRQHTITTWRRRAVVATVLVLSLLAIHTRLDADRTFSPPAAPATCAEDEACWDPFTMGNRVACDDFDGTGWRCVDGVTGATVPRPGGPLPAGWTPPARPGQN